MHFYLIGINYKTAPLSVREDIYRNKRQIYEFWKAHAPLESAVLLTCNRLEIYGIAKNAYQPLENIGKFSSLFPEFIKYAYTIHGKDDLFKHALRLVCGLESQLKGELQISLQLQSWLKEERLCRQLKDLWNRAIYLSKKIRVISGLDNENNNIASVVFLDLKNLRKFDNPIEILVVGTGKIAELISRFSRPEIKLNFFAHKNYAKAKLLADNSNGNAYLLKDLSKFLFKADALISATTSPHYVIANEQFDNILGKRKCPLYIYDLALPRDIDPKAGLNKDIILRNLDDLNPAIDDFNQRNLERINLASYLIEESLNKYQEEFHESKY